MVILPFVLQIQPPGPASQAAIPAFEQPPWQYVENAVIDTALNASRKHAQSSVLQEDSSIPAGEYGDRATQDSESLGSDSSDEAGDADAERSFGVRTGEENLHQSAAEAM